MAASCVSSSSLEGSVGKDEKIDTLFRNFTYKCLQIIVQSRIELQRLKTPKDSVSDYFSLTVTDYHTVEEQIKKILDGKGSFPVKDQNVCVEVSLVTNDGDHMFLETWDLGFDQSSLDISANKKQQIFTRMCVTLKSLLCATRALPAFKLARNQGEKGGGYILNYRLYLGKPLTHMLGEGFKSVRAGSVPTAQGLLSINSSFRTKLLLSPEMSASSMAAIEVTDNYFHKEYRAASVPPLSEPQPCSSPRNRSQSESPCPFAISPLPLEKEDNTLKTRRSTEGEPWKRTSILDLDELPEQLIGPFSNHKPMEKTFDHEVPFEGLMRRSIMARQERQKAMERASRGEEEEKKENEEEKENLPATIDLLRGQRMSVEDEFVMVDKPPFAADDDPRDVHAFLGEMFRAPKLTEPLETKISVGDYLSDVGALVSRLEEDMPVLDEFCQSVINLNSQEEDEEEASVFS